MHYTSTYVSYMAQKAHIRRASLHAGSTNMHGYFVFFSFCVVFGFHLSCVFACNQNISGYQESIYQYIWVTLRVLNLQKHSFSKTAFQITYICKGIELVMKKRATNADSKEWDEKFLHFQMRYEALLCSSTSIYTKEKTRKTKRIKCRMLMRIKIKSALLQAVSKSAEQSFVLI